MLEALLIAWRYCCSSSFTHLSKTTLRLPWWYAASSSTYALVGVALIAYGARRFLVEGLAWCCVGVTSHLADVRYFGDPGCWAVIDVFVAVSAIAITTRNSPPGAVFSILAIALYFFISGQRKAVHDRSKLVDHALWHYSAQIGRFAVFLAWQLCTGESNALTDDGRCDHPRS